MKKSVNTRTANLRGLGLFNEIKRLDFEERRRMIRNSTLRWGSPEVEDVGGPLIAPAHEEPESNPEKNIVDQVKDAVKAIDKDLQPEKEKAPLWMIIALIVFGVVAFVALKKTLKKWH